MLTKHRIEKMVEGGSYALTFKAGRYFSGERIIGFDEKRQLDEALERLRVKQSLEKYGEDNESV